MHGATSLTKNIRRTGIPATKRGQPNPAYAEAVGPTLERLAAAGHNFTVGGDERTGTRVYHFHDSPLDRLYSRLKQADKSREGFAAVMSEWTALRKYRHHWYFAGLDPSPRTVDLNRIFCPDATNMSGMAKTEQQSFHRQMYRKAAEIIGHKSSILIDNFVCYEWDRGIACDLSPYLFRKSVREAAAKLARYWDI